MYQNQFVAVVKYNGKVLREKDNVVTLNFGSEYSLFLKNLSSQRANVKISIDGQDVLYGSSLIIDPNSQTDLVGFLDGCTVRHKFKFIQKTKQIQDHRGDRIDDGIIRIEYAFEKKPDIVQRKTIIHDDYYPYPRRRYFYDYHPPLFSDNIHWTSSGIKGMTERSIGSNASPIYSNCASNLGEKVMTSNVSNSQVVNDMPNDDEGITVQGSNVRQDFHYASVGELEPSEVIIIKLRGTKSTGATVSEPVTVKTKFTCPTCGKKSSSSARFCAQCGTNLEV